MKMKYKIAVMSGIWALWGDLIEYYRSQRISSILIRMHPKCQAILFAVLNPVNALCEGVNYISHSTEVL
jgi:hypothetical protein